MDELNRNERILTRLIASNSQNATAADIEEIKKAAQALSGVSSRHHYIPQHYIRGFTGNDRLLSVYDKKLDKLKSKRVGSNGVFYQKDRNTVEIDELKISIIEDYFFSKIDNEFSILIKKLREDANDGTLLSVYNQGSISAFIIDLFWRNPITDHAFADLYQRAQITFKDLSTENEFHDKVLEQQMKNDPVQKTLQRSAMTINAINEILKARPQGDSTSKFWEFEDELFVLGDYPMLFQQIPKNQTDLITMNFFLPISANRLYASMNSRGLSFGTKDAYLLNALIIDQSRTIVCSPNRLLLENSVEYYRELKKRGILPHLKQMLFSRISD